MDEITIIGRMAVALAVGLVIGLERGWSERNAPEGSRVAGLRTFALIGFAGGIDALVGLELSAVVAAMVAFALAGLLVAVRLAPPPSDDIGATTEVAAIVTFALGLIAGLGHAVPAAAGAVATALLLGLKPVLHRWLRALAQREMFAALQLFLISAVVLPLLPDEAMGPYDAINPYRLWWMVVLIATVSLAGYAAMRVLGARAGILVTGLCGGLISSTATTLALARRANTLGDLGGATTASILATCTTMVVRIAAISLAVWPPLALGLAAPLGAMAIIGAAATIWFWRNGAHERETSPAIAPGNPLDLPAAVAFGVLLACIMVLAQASRSAFGPPGLYVLSGISGLVDVDAISLSVAEDAQRSLGIDIAAISLVIAACVNTAVKAGFTIAVAPARIARRVGPVLVGMILVGVLALAITRL